MAIDNKTQRLQVTLSETTLRLIEDIVAKGRFQSKSAFLNEAARIYATRLKRANLKRKLRAGYMARAEENRKLVNEWEAASSELLSDEDNA